VVPALMEQADGGGEDLLPALRAALGPCQLLCHERVR